MDLASWPLLIGVGGLVWSRPIEWLGGSRQRPLTLGGR